ncbi:MAG: hypothetical protein K0U52_13530 [Gammaproteobacteria bacterium]|nr:hypothetical protein [Gammaproteobacteria bacterium]
MASRFAITRSIAVNEPDARMILINWSSSVMSFITALQWQKFVENVIHDISRKGKHPLPRSVSSLISSLIITAVATAVLYGLYTTAKRIVKEEDNVLIKKNVSASRVLEDDEETDV